MNREENKNAIYNFFRKQLQLLENPTRAPQIQMGALYHLFDEPLKSLAAWEKTRVYSVVRETVQELISNGMIYPGLPDDQNSHYPWLSITEYGKNAFAQENWLPYDPEGYLYALKTGVPDIDDITLTYIGESVAAFNRRNLLSASITIGVASENLILLLIEAYLHWISDARRKTRLEGKIKNRFIYTQYLEFKKEFLIDINSLPDDLKSNWEVYLDGIFNFIRLNRNSAGHPTGIKVDTKIVYANLQIFAEYSRYLFKLINHFS